MTSRLCPFCMQMADSETCPHCGKTINYTGSPAHLPAGSVVSGKHPYVLGAALGQGGFGITYIALDMVTKERVAIKEYYPAHCSTRSGSPTVTAYANQEDVYLKGKERFLNEARTLKSLSDLKNIVNVLDFFETNNSAYLVMEFLEGDSLKAHAAKHGKFPAQKFLNQIKPLMEDLEKMHQRGVIHRDIAPDNIILLPDGQMKLIDFGAARSYMGDKSMTVVVKKGFAPVEQYMSKGSSASTDIYALAATIYYCVTGSVPPDSAERQYDHTVLKPPSSLGADLTPTQEQALLHALNIHQKDRPQSMQQFLEYLAGTQSCPPESETVAVSNSGKSLKNTDTTRVQNKPNQTKQLFTIAAALLMVVAIVGFAIGNLPQKESTEKLDADTQYASVESTAATTPTTEAATVPPETTEPVPTEPAAEEPAWKQNYLMADLTFDEDEAQFEAAHPVARIEVYYDYYSARPVFNTDIPRSKITEVFFLDSFESAPEEVYDVSANQDGSVLAWTKKNRSGLLNLYIAGEGGVNGSIACRSFFHGYIKLETIHFDQCFFTDTAQDMSNMFAYCPKLKTVDLSSLNTASVTDMSSMFYNCTSLTMLDLSNFDTSKVTSMENMFKSCKSLTDLDLSSFDTSNVIYMWNMFSWCESLTELDLSHFNTSNVTYMMGMFSRCYGLTSLNLSSFDTSNVTNMHFMFQDCRKLTELDLTNFDTSKVTDMSYMFYGLQRVTSLDLSSFDTSSVTDMSCMFLYCNNLESVDLSNFDTSNVTNMSEMFRECYKIKDVKIGDWNTSKVTNYENFMEARKTVNGRPWQELFSQSIKVPSGAKDPEQASVSG